MLDPSLSVLKSRTILLKSVIGFAFQLGTGIDSEIQVWHNLQRVLQQYFPRACYFEGRQQASHRSFLLTYLS